jgi:histone H3/H4
MSSDVPGDLQPYFSSLNQNAVGLMRDGNYRLAEQLFQTMLETILERQRTEKRRIHKGSFYYNLGLVKTLQEKLVDAYTDFLLAYIEDCINSPVGSEENAEFAPAARALMNGFKMQLSDLRHIQGIVRLKRDTNELFDPNVILTEFVKHLDRPQKTLIALLPDGLKIDQVKNELIVTLSPKAQQSLNEVATKMANKVLHRARIIAKKRNSPTVTEEDIVLAITELKGEGM